MDTGALNMDMKLKIKTFMQECSEKNLTYSFKSLKKDICDKCETFNHTPITGRIEEIKNEHMKHIEEKELAGDYRATLTLNDKDEKTVLVAAFDLEKCLFSY